MSDTNLSKRIVEEIIELGEEIEAIKGLSTQPYLFSHEAKEIRIYPEGTAPELEAREDGVLYLCETKEETDIDPMKVYIGKGIEVVANDVSYGKMPLNEGSWGKKELFAPKENKEDEKPGEMVLVCKIPSANYALDLSPWLSAAPGDGTTDISIDWGDKTSAVALRGKASYSGSFEVYTVEEREDEPVSEEDDRHVEETELDRLEGAKSDFAAVSSVDYPVIETPGTGTITHTYAAAGEYRITLKGSFKWGLGKSTSNTSLQATLTSVELPSGNSPIKHVSTYAFYRSPSLTSIPQGLFDNCTEVTSFYSCFYYCTALTSIPAGLFDNCTKVTNFSYCFYKCSALTSIPAGLFNNCTEVTNFTYCFRDCGALTSIPQGLFDKCTKVTNFTYCFSGCETLTSIPAGLFDNCTEVTSFQQCFYYCTALTSIPQGLFDKCTKVTNFDYCFGYCIAITSIPAGLFNNCTKVITFTYCFNSCSAITSALPTLWISHPSALHSQCFTGCTKATNYAAAQAAGWA